MRCEASAMAATARAPKNSISLRRAAASARSTCVCSAPSSASLRSIGVERLVGQPDEAALVALDGVEARLDILAAALQVGDLVVARVLEGLFERLEAPRAVGFLGHVGDRLARFLAARRSSRAMVPLMRSNCTAASATKPSRPTHLPWARRGHRDHLFALQHDATPNRTPLTWKLSRAMANGV